MPEALKSNASPQLFNLFKWSFQFLILGLAFSLSTSKFGMSLGQLIAGGLFLLGLVFFGSKYRRPSRLFWIAIFLILVHLIWFLPGGDWKYGIRDLTTKIPLLSFPLFFFCAPKEWIPQEKQMFWAAATGFLLSSLFSFGLYFEIIPWEVHDFRDISPLISHIRLSIAGVIVYLWCTRFLPFRSILFVLITFYVIGFFIILQSLSGFLLLFFSLFVLGIKLQKSIWKWVAILTPSLLLLLGIFAWFNHNQTNSIRALPTDQKTALGHTYEHFPNSKQVENNTPTWTYLCWGEIRMEWKKRSSISPDSNGTHGHKIEPILVRYLSSKGLRKDAEGVRQLSERDIQLIEQGVPNHLYPNWSPIRRRIHKLFTEINEFRDGIPPNGHSITLRLVYAKLGLQIWLKNPWFGVGTCNIKSAFKEEYTQAETQILAPYQRRSHNQWISFLAAFGIIGTLLIAFSVSIPLCLKWRSMPLPFWIICSLLLFSFLWEDTLETQAGVTLFSFFFFYACSEVGWKSPNTLR